MSERSVCTGGTVSRYVLHVECICVVREMSDNEREERTMIKSIQIHPLSITIFVIAWPSLRTPNLLCPSLIQTKEMLPRILLFSFLVYSLRLSSANYSKSACFIPSLVRNAGLKSVGKERNGWDQRFNLNSWRQGKPPLRMSLIPVDRETLGEIITKRLPTPAQYAAYWGRTSREQYNAGFEAFGVSFLGVFAAYFLSFAFGQFIATILGMIAGSWVLLGPELKAYQRNWELTGGRELVDPWTDENDYYYGDDDEDNRGLYGSLYFGRISHVCIVEDPLDLPEDEYTLDEFEGYTMETDELESLTGNPYSLRLRVTDDKFSDYGSNGRELQIHTRMSEEYLDLELGMPVCTLLLSTSQKFKSLAALTDFCVPDAGTWVGDYPYLDRPVLENLFARDDEIWDALRNEGRGPWDERDWIDDDEIDEDDEID